MNKIRLVVASLLLGAVTGFAQKPFNASGTGNPIIPGYFADPTVKKFGDTYYMYATTDGSGAGFGPAQVWTSKDFVNWTLMPMNWPDSHWIWAPDVMKHTDGNYYYFYCQPCMIHCGVSETPRGPWKNILGESEAVLVPDRFVTNAITLDGQTFVDDDGSVYLYWGTWGIYKGFGCGAGKLASDMKSFTETRLIPNTEATDFFEAPFVMKRKGIYYFMYSSGSCHDHTYRVQYATSDKPMGPYTYRGCILETNADGTIHGPGHHSVLKEGNEYYMVYHRHDNPHSNRGFHRQLCVDRMEFAEDGSIKSLIPTHDGIGALASSVVKSKNLALGAKVRASSFYDAGFRPEYAVDDNNGTLWRPRGMGQEWIEVDLGVARQIQTIWTQFEYGTQFYQYLIETSVDGKHWSVFADKRNNRLAGSPMVDFGTSADRIAAGSIAASKLDAASIRSSIINTDYINGLSCTFTKGKIGGWMIGASALTATHISIDSGNRRIAVYGANSGVASGQRVQLYYNSDTDFGLYTTDSAGYCVAQLGSSNSIAGWTIDTTSIRKGNVSLGSDGSIINSTKWKLNNDGSGQIASGNIAWDTAGNVTFGASVSLQWKNDIEAAKVTNFGYRYYKKLIINGDEATYYPVVFKGGDQNIKRTILVRRGYAEQAPVSWNTSTHKGGLIVLIKTNFGGWGGIAYSWDIYDLSETYCRMFAGAQLCGNYCITFS